MGTVLYLISIFNFERRLSWRGTVFCAVYSFFKSHLVSYWKLEYRINRSRYILIRLANKSIIPL